MFGIKIFHGLRIGEVLFDQWLGQPFDNTGNQVFWVIVGGTEKRNNRGIGYVVEAHPANHISMKEIGNDDRWLFCVNNGA